MTLSSTQSKLLNATEADYQAVLVAQLHGNIPTNRDIQTFVAITDGEIDVLTTEEIIECKRMLTRDALLQALGQLQLYAAAYPERELAIAGPLPHAKHYPEARKVAKAMLDRIQAIGVNAYILPRMTPNDPLKDFLTHHHLPLASKALIEVEETAQIQEQPLESFIAQLKELH